MKKRRGGRRLALLVVAAAAVGAGVGIAYAAIPDGSGVIHGCYSNTSGALRVIDTGAGQRCSAAEKAVDWSQTGPQGAQGPQGPQGPQGQRGPSDAFTKYSNTRIDISCCATSTISSLALPAGSFLLTGAVQIADSTPNDFGAVGACFFASSEPGQIGAFKLARNEVATAPVTGLVTLAAAQSVELRCRDDGPDDIAVFSWRMTALQVGTLSDQS
jgi:hypothetical protein